MNLIRPRDEELNGGSGTYGCDGADIWAMLTAARAGDTAAIRSLLEKDRRLSIAEYWYTQPIHFAVREGHAEAVRLLLEAGADPTAIRYGGEELTVVARDRGHEEVAQILEDARCSRFACVLSEQEIHRAAAAGDETQVRELLMADPTLVHLRDADARTPLHRAAASGCIAVQNLLIATGADPDAVAGTSGTYAAAGFTPIDAAIWTSDFWVGTREDWASVGNLLDHGATYTATVAAALGDGARIEALVSASADAANAAQPSGRRPLSTAIQFGHIGLAEWLLANGADPKLPEGRFAAHGCAAYFAARDKQYELLRTLLERGADPNGGIDSCGDCWHVADTEGRLLLYRYGLRHSYLDPENVDLLAFAAERDPEFVSHTGCGTIFTQIVCNDWGKEPTAETDQRKKDTALMLLDRGVRVPAVVTECRGYLFHKPALTRVLLEHGMSPNLPNWQSVTPLHDMCSTGAKGAPNPNRIELAEMLLEFGADIDARDEEYRSTPLGWAARCGLRDMAELLLVRGAKVNVTSEESWASPLAWARKRGHAEIAQILVEHGAA